jgi:hypothetical protein
MDTVRYHSTICLEETWVIMKNSWPANLLIKNQIHYLPNKKQEYRTYGEYTMYF